MPKRKNAPAGIERRDLIGTDTQVTDDGKIRGLFVPFNSLTTIGFGPFAFREKVAPGAITKTIAEADIVYLDNHDPSRPVARKSAGTLDIQETERGGVYVATPAETTYARDLVTNIRAKNIRGNSFGFECVKEAWEDGENGDLDTRTILEMKLVEISSCTFPAYEDTTISARSQYETAMESRARYLERLMRAKYTDSEIEALGKKGEAYRNPDGHYSYPVADAEDLQNAIRAVGRGGADHDAIRKYIIGRAKALGLAAKVPENWNSDGSLDEQNSAAVPESRDVIIVTDDDDDAEPDGDEGPEPGACTGCTASGEWGRYCSQCGTQLVSAPPEPKYCTTCGASMDDGERGTHTCQETRDADKPAEPADSATPESAELTDTLRRAAFSVIEP